MQQQITKISIPDNLAFSDLHLSRDSDGSVSFDWAVIEQICQANKLPAQIFRDTTEDNVCGLIVGWYQAHKQHGGKYDAVAEDLISEVIAEEKAGQKVSHQPGRA